MTALTETLGKLFPKTDVSIYDYADRVDFDRLWGALDDRCATLPGKVVIIVWSHTAGDAAITPVATEPFITPLEWAACAAISRPDIAVKVIDLRPQAHREYPAVRLYEHLDRQQLSWLHVLHASSLIVSPRSGLETLLLAPRRDATDMPPAEFLTMRRITFADPDPLSIRHAITNLIGPLLLLHSRHEELTGHTKALRHLLHYSGLVPDVDEPRQAPGEAMLTALRKLAPIRFVLLDDQWHQGWAEWVSQRLGLAWDQRRLLTSASTSHEPQCLLGEPDNGISLWVTTSPTWLLTRITTELEKAAKVGAADARFRLHLTADSPHASEVLLLDLRLFQPGGLAEQQFVAAALPLAQRFSTGAGHLSPWPPFTSDELASFGRWTISPERTGEHSIILTLLPRIIALADMSLPILLFSSTGRRDILETLNDYESIVTRFSKPRFFGDRTSIVAEVTHAFDEALADATALLRGRKCIAHFVSHPPSLLSDHEHKYGHAAFYVDESGNAKDPCFTVGGLLGLFRDREHELSFDQLLQNDGIHWGPGGLPKSTHATPDQKENTFARVSTLARDNNVLLRVVAFVVSKPSASKSSRTLQMWPDGHLDFLHRSLIRAATEATLFHAIRDSDMSKHWTFSLLTDMRSPPLLDIRDEATLECFGLRSQALDSYSREQQAVLDTIKMLRALKLPESTLLADSLVPYKKRGYQARIPYISSNGVYPILLDLLHQYETVPRLQFVRVIEAQACYIPEGRPTARNWPNRSLHFLADWVVGDIHTHRWPSNTLPAWIQALVDDGGIIASFDSATTAHLAIARHVLAGDTAMAAARLFMQHSLVASPLKDQCAALVVEALRTASGSIFVDACRRTSFRAKTAAQPVT